MPSRQKLSGGKEFDRGAAAASGERGEGSSGSGLPVRGESDTRQRILDAARLLFWEKGYNATSMADILERSAARSGSFYYFFRSKSALLEGVLEEYLRCLGPEVVEPVLAASADPVERVFGMLGRYRGLLLHTGFTYGCPLGRLALEIDPGHRKAFDLIAANFNGWTGVVRDSLNACRDRLPPEVDTQALATFVLTIMEGAVMQARVHRSIEPFDVCVIQLKDYFGRLGMVSSNPGEHGLIAGEK
jgi:TetR/AcrR family transcriptional regulator, transcriptional repressor for nem operon